MSPHSNMTGLPNQRKCSDNVFNVEAGWRGVWWVGELVCCSRFNHLAKRGWKKEGRHGGTWLQYGHRAQKMMTKEIERSREILTFGSCTRWVCVDLYSLLGAPLTAQSPAAPQQPTNQTHKKSKISPSAEISRTWIFSISAFLLVGLRSRTFLK